MDPENEILRKILKNVRYLKNFHLRWMELKPRRNKLFQGENGPGKSDAWRDVSHVSHV